MESKPALTMPAAWLNPPFHGLTRLICAAIAVFGTLLFGTAMFLNGFGAEWAAAHGLRLIAITGISWVALGAALLLWSRLPFWSIFDGCLATMVVGEVILVTAGAICLVLPGNLGIGLGWAGMLAANITMAAFLARILRNHGFASWKTWTLWFAVLNALAVLITFGFYH